METSFVDAPSFINKLKSLLSDCDKLDVAMAYVRIKGLRPFLSALEGSILMKENKPIRIVLGLSSFQGITDKESAELLLKFSRRARNVTVRKYDNRKFHPKLMVFYGHPNRVLIGSSNLTEGGQSKNVEANVVVEGPDSEFIKDVAEFFDFLFRKAPNLEQRHIKSYAPRTHLRSQGSRGSFREDPLPSLWKSLPSPTGRGRGAGTPIKPKSYYNRKIHELESKKALTTQQKRSLTAYRALRTRYYPSRRGQRTAILLPVKRGKEQLDTIIRNGHGAWTPGLRIRRDVSLKGAHVYFYETGIRRVRYRATIQTFHHTKTETLLTVFKLQKLKKSRRLHRFKKWDGENILGTQHFVFILDPVV